MVAAWKHNGLAILFMGLFLALGQAWGASDFLPRYLEMLGYSEAEIEQLLSGTARLRALDEAYQLEAMGYSAEEIEKILTGGMKRRQMDAAYGQKALAEAGGESPNLVAATGEDMHNGRLDAVGGDEGIATLPDPAGTDAALDLPWSATDAHADLQRARVRARPFLGTVRTTAQRYEVDPALILAVIAAESDFEPRAVSPKGAIGLMQLMPHTGAIFGASLGDLFDPGSNILAGTRFLAECLEQFADERLALAAYNAGPGRVVRHQGIPPFDETRRYVAKVLHLRQYYRVLLDQYPRG